MDENNQDLNEIKYFHIDQQLSESEQNELKVFQRAMAFLEDEYLQVLRQIHPNQIAIFKLNEEEANEKIRVAANDKSMRLSAIDTIYEEEQRSIKKKFENAEKSLFERTSSSIFKCDSHLVNELKSMFPERRRKFDSLSLDIPRPPNDGQIMQKVVHIVPKPLGILVNEHRDHDFAAIKDEMDNINKEEGISAFVDKSSNKHANFKFRKSRFSVDTSNKERVENSDMSDNEDE